MKQIINCKDCSIKFNRKGNRSKLCLVCKSIRLKKSIYKKNKKAYDKKKSIKNITIN